jgi:integrase
MAAKDRHLRKRHNRHQLGYPIIGKLLPHEINTDDVLNVLRQKHIRSGQHGTLWTNARETASRVRSRIEIVIGAAKAKGLSNRETRELWTNHHNPAQWQDNLEHWLNGKQSKKHFDAMDWNDAPAFVKELRQKTDYSAKALSLTILCVTRTNETINATWPEFDLDNSIWTIPAERMKAGVEHRICDCATAIPIRSQRHPMGRGSIIASCTPSQMASCKTLRYRCLPFLLVKCCSLTATVPMWPPCFDLCSRPTQRRSAVEPNVPHIPI